jgi:hypothetical protein
LHYADLSTASVGWIYGVPDGGHVLFVGLGFRPQLSESYRSAVRARAGVYSSGGLFGGRIVAGLCLMARLLLAPFRGASSPG